MSKRPITSNPNPSPVLLPRGLRTEQAAQYSGLSPFYIEELIRNGTLPAVGGPGSGVCAAYIVLREHLDECLDKLAGKRLNVRSSAAKRVVAPPDGRFKFVGSRSRVSGVPVCNKCKKHSNCLTIDPCDHCGAKDWDEATVLTFSGKPKGESSAKTYVQTSRTSQGSDRAGCLLALVVLAAIGFGIYYVFFMSDSEQLSSKYNVPVERVTAPPKPHGCAFSDAPLGDKHCHYDKHVYVYDITGQVIQIDGKPQSCPAGCGPAYSVGQVFVRVED